jgi:hypothetical protein
MSDPSPYVVAHRSAFADDIAMEDPFSAPGAPFDLSTSTRYKYFSFCFVVVCVVQNNKNNKTKAMSVNI